MAFFFFFFFRLSPPFTFPVMTEDRGRSFERRTHGYSRWTDKEKVTVPGLPLFVPDALEEPELEALLLRFRIDEIGYKLAQNQLDVELRGRCVLALR